MRAVTDQQWAGERVATLPARWQRRLLGKWERARGPHQGRTWAAEIEAQRAANIELLRLTERLTAVRWNLDASDAEICALADAQAKRCLEMAGVYPHEHELHPAMERVCRGHGVEPPKVRRCKDVPPAIKRMIDPLWWRRALRKAHAKAVEGAAIRLGVVNRSQDPYISNESLRRREQQNRRNAEGLEATIARNELGQEYTLAELAAKGPANKAIRRAELMTRISGFERIARDLGHEGLFFTITCPSRMHKWRTIKNRAGRIVSVKENPRYDGTNPREAQAHLAAVWARIRAALARHGVTLYGFRIAEPNHDGTPHWHVLAFHESQWRGRQDAMSLPRIAAIIRRYALGRGEVKEPNHLTEAFHQFPYRSKRLAIMAAQGRAERAAHRWAVDERKRQNAEPGAKKRRVDFKPIDWERGTAAGYIAKYVAKNIDGYRVEKDLIGNDALETAARVEAWASTWGIRQFQQIGGAPVTVWRELRRVESIPEGAPDHLKAAHRAVNKLAVIEGKENQSVAWDHYCRAQGGVFVGRQYRIRIATAEREGKNRYGEPLADVPVGVETVSREEYTPAHMAHMGGRATRVIHWIVESSRHVWEIVTRKARGASEGLNRAFGAAWTCVNNCTESIEDGREIHAGTTGGHEGGAGFEGTASLGSGTGHDSSDGRAVHGPRDRGIGGHGPGVGRLAFAA